MTERPYKLPEGWRWVRLGKVAQRESVIVKPSDQPNSTFRYLGMEHVAPGQWEEPCPVEVRGSDIRSQVIAFCPGLVLYGKLRPYLNKVVVPSREGVASTEFVPIAVRQDMVSPDYLGAFLRSPRFVAYAGRNIAGSRQPRTRLDALWGVLVPLPPLEEQRRIVARIEELMERVREAKCLRRQAKEDAERLWQSALVETFPRPGTEPPPGWRWMRLGEVCQVIMGQSPPSKTYNLDGNGLPFYQGKADFGDLYPNPRVWCSSPQKIAYPGDVLLSVRAPIGPTNFAKAKCCIGRGLAALRPRESLDQFWLFFYFRSIEWNLAQIGTGSTFTAITKVDLAQLLIPLPPLDEQRQIVAHLEAVQEKVKALKEVQAATEAELQRLEQAILDRAFRGEL